MAPTQIAYPDWTDYRDRSGLDPLGMQKGSVNLYQRLLPGISNVTLRMRYYGLYAWLSLVNAQEGSRSTDPHECRHRIQNAAKASEALTNPRLVAQARTSDDTRSPRLQNWNHAPFAYKNPEGTYLLRPAFGALDLVETRRGALVYFLLRRELFLSRTSEAATSLDMRLLITPVDGSFVDLTGLAPNLSKEARWDIGQTLLEEGAVGAITKQVEVPGTLFLSIFDGSVLGSTVQGAHYRFLWDGNKIKRIYDFETAETITREELMVMPVDAPVA